MHSYSGTVINILFPKESPSWALLAICSLQSSYRGKLVNRRYFSAPIYSLSMAGQRCPVLWTRCCWGWPCTTRCSSWPRWWWSGCPAFTPTAPTSSTPSRMTGQKVELQTEVKRRFANISQSQRRPLLGLSHLRHYDKWAHKHKHGK